MALNFLMHSNALDKERNALATLSQNEGVK